MVDALDSKSGIRKNVGVQVPPCPPIINFLLKGAICKIKNSGFNTQSFLFVFQIGLLQKCMSGY